MKRYTFTAIALVCLCLFDLAAATDAAGLSSLYGTWNVRVLLPGHPGIPPHYTLTMERTVATLSETPATALTRVAMQVGESLGLLSATTNAVPPDAGVCRFPEGVPSVMLTAALDEDGKNWRVDCNDALLGGFTERELTLWGPGYVRTYPEPLPLFSRNASGVGEGRCVALPWAVRTMSIQHPSAARILVSMHLQTDMAAGPAQTCIALFDLNKLPASSQKDWRSYTGPVLMLAIVIAVRTLPRYYLQRTGSIDADSFRTGKAPQLTPQKRAELLRRQREIIAQMKREDGIDER